MPISLFTASHPVVVIVNQYYTVLSYSNTINIIIKRKQSYEESKKKEETYNNEIRETKRELKELELKIQTQIQTEKIQSSQSLSKGNNS